MTRAAVKSTGSYVPASRRITVSDGSAALIPVHTRLAVAVGPRWA
jgi:hypothetical protein